MILFFNEQPVTELVKIEKMFDRAKELYGSEFYNIQNIPWFGDNITVESLFPSWILKEYDKNPNNVLVVPLIKNYIRWLLSLEYGYGAQLNWENLRVPLYTNSIFLEALADFNFNGADFSVSPLKETLPNLRKFLIKSDENYFNQKGTPEAIKYLITNLLGFKITDVEIYTSNYGVLQIKIKNSEYNSFIKFQTFLEQHVLPAGISILYGVK
jgi:hypothetical protein